MSEPIIPIVPNGTAPGQVRTRALSRQGWKVQRGRRSLVWAGGAAAVAVTAVLLIAGRHLLLGGSPTPAEVPGFPRLHAELVPDRPDTIRVPPDAARSLGVQTVVAEEATAPHPLELPGSLALDPDRMVRVHARFPGEVVELGQATDGSGDFATVPRPVRFGDEVTKDQLLAVVWSKDLGEKKSELVDALSQLKTDQDTLDQYEKLDRQGAIPEGQLRQQRRAVESDLNAVNRAERTLRVWRLGDREIQELRDEAGRIRERGGRRDPEKEREWARVEVRSPLAGVVVEKNVSVGDIVDTAADLFKVANTDVLAVWAHAYEEDLPALRALPPDRLRWAVGLPGDPTAAPIPGSIERIGYVVDPSQHTALVLGRVQNPGGALRAGQFIAATVELPPPPAAVAVPTSALVEADGRTGVFVQPDPQRQEYTLRPVLVVQRRHAVVFVRWVRPEWLLLSLPRPGAPLDAAVGTLTELPAAEPRVRVVSAGALLMKAALEDLQSAR
jgi:cobalt-zinc-cadmium efflux system membrane fusion protein